MKGMVYFPTFFLCWDENDLYFKDFMTFALVIVDLDNMLILNLTSTLILTLNLFLAFTLTL